MDKDRIAGAAKEAKGAVKEAAGKVMGDAGCRAKARPTRRKASCRTRSAA